MAEQVQDLAASLVAGGKEILANDTLPTLTRRFDAPAIPSTAESRRSCREMPFRRRGAIAVRARRNSAARIGAYAQDMETASA